MKPGYLCTVVFVVINMGILFRAVSGHFVVKPSFAEMMFGFA